MGVLDETFGANGVAAYSIVRVRAAYSGNCLRVRRDSDNVEADIGFDANDVLDYAAIETHCGTANGFVVTWYDQSGNGHDITQPAAGQQPQICIHGKAIEALLYDGTDDSLELTFGAGHTFRNLGDSFTFHAWVAGAGSGINNLINLGQGGASNYVRMMWRPDLSNGFTVQHRENVSIVGIAHSAAGGNFLDWQQAAMVRNSDSSISCFRNGGDKNSDTTTVNPDDSLWDSFRVGVWNDVRQNYMTGLVSEIIVFDDNKSDAQVASLHSHGRPNAKADLLVDQAHSSDAKHAWSLRKVRDLYGGPLVTVRETGGSTEQDFYPSPIDGDLPVGAIEEFIGANDGRLAKLFDQSGENADWAQTTAANQPKIAAAGTVTLYGSNNRPGIDFGATEDDWWLDASLTLGGDNTFAIVCRSSDATPDQQILNTNAQPSGGGSYTIGVGSWIAETLSGWVYDGVTRGRSDMATTFEDLTIKIAEYKWDEDGNTNIFEDGEKGSDGSGVAVSAVAATARLGRHASVLTVNWDGQAFEVIITPNVKTDENSTSQRDDQSEYWVETAPIAQEGVVSHAVAFKPTGKPTAPVTCYIEDRGNLVHETE